MTEAKQDTAKEYNVTYQQSTISQRWAFYINGDRKGSAPSKAQAETAAAEYIERMKRGTVQ